MIDFSFMGFLLVSEFSAASCWFSTADFFGLIPTESRSTEDNFGSACFQTQSDSKTLLQGTLSGMFLWNPRGIEILFFLKTELPQELLQIKSQNCLFNFFFFLKDCMTLMGSVGIYHHIQKVYSEKINYSYTATILWGRVNHWWYRIS